MGDWFRLDTNVYKKVAVTVVSDLPSNVVKEPIQLHKWVTPFGLTISPQSPMHMVKLKGIGPKHMQNMWNSSKK